MSPLIQQQLLRAQQRMKHKTDKRRSERTFQVGDLVFLKLQPYMQISVAKRSNQKLSYKYFGPYKVQQKVGEVAYKPELLPKLIHPVVHVSRLKKAIKPTDQVCTDLPSSCVRSVEMEQP